MFAKQNQFLLILILTVELIDTFSKQRYQPIAKNCTELVWIVDKFDSNIKYRFIRDDNDDVEMAVSTPVSSKKPWYKKVWSASKSVFSLNGLMYSTTAISILAPIVSSIASFFFKSPNPEDYLPPDIKFDTFTRSQSVNNNGFWSTNTILLIFIVVLVNIFIFVFLIKDSQKNTQRISSKTFRKKSKKKSKKK